MKFKNRSYKAYKTRMLFIKVLKYILPSKYYIFYDGTILEIRKKETIVENKLEIKYFNLEKTLQHLGFVEQNNSGIKEYIRNFTVITEICGLYYIGHTINKNLTFIGDNLERDLVPFINYFNRI